MSGLTSVIPANAGIQWPNQAVCVRKYGIQHILDSGFRRSDGIANSYAIALARKVLVLATAIRPG